MSLAILSHFSLLASVLGPSFALVLELSVRTPVSVRSPLLYLFCGLQSHPLQSLNRA
jgi:hypothetical protein